MNPLPHPSFLFKSTAESFGWKVIFQDSDHRCERLGCPSLPLTFQRGKTFLWQGNASGKGQVWHCFEMEGWERSNVRFYHDLDSAFSKEGPPVLDGLHPNQDTQEGAGS